MSATPDKLAAGGAATVIHKVKFPFVREEYSGPLDGEFVDDAQTWKPGTRHEFSEGDYDTDEWWMADGEGLMLLEVLSTHKPGKYPERTFYLRRFIDPAGREFGKAKVRVIASSAFKAMCRGYRHEYTLPELATTASPTAPEAQRTES